MIKETVVWTLLPDPAAPSGDGFARLSLVFGFQLSTDEGGSTGLPLSRFPRVAAWPDFTFDLRVTFRRNGETATVPATVEAIPRPALWGALFAPSTTRVASYLFDHTVSSDPLQSYPVHLVSRSLREEYGRLFTVVDGASRGRSAVAADAEPVRTGEWRAVDEFVGRVGRARGTPCTEPYESMLRQGVLPDDFPQDPFGWLRVLDFHQPFAASLPELSKGESPLPRETQQPDRDFHGILAALADHPGLMSLIGLVRQVKVAVPAGLNGPVAIQADPGNTQFIRNDRPYTQCVARGDRLFLARRSGTEAALHLPLDDVSRYTVLDIDVDTASLALQSYADMLAGLPRTGKAPPLRAPAPRSDGISVAERERQVAFRRTLREAAALDTDLQNATRPGDAVTLHADNVQQGYRVDVFDERSARWYPLCRRTGQYTVQGVGTPLPIDDEGAVTDALTRGKDAQGNRVSRLHQSLFRWIGWSLVAEPPGKMLDTSEQLQDPRPTRDPTLPFSCEVRPADGTLPSLRYGRSYRFRARLVDLAGRSLPFTAQATAGEPATPPLRYSRYEPVPAPVLVPRRAVTSGESLTVLVVRTDNADAASPPVPGPTCERHLLPPKAAVQMLERHGVLDLVAQHRLDPAVHALLSLLDGGTVQGERDLGAGGTPFVDAGAMDLPWLPDPLSRGAALHGLPGAPELLAAWPRGNAWHERLPVRLVVVPGGTGGTPPPVFDAAGRVIRVTLPPGATSTSLLSSMLTPGDEDLLGLWHWFTESGDRSAEELRTARTQAVAGRVAQLTPTTELRMVHAVKCPVDPPAFSRPRIARAPQETAYVLDDPGMTVHEPSTLSVHTEVLWNEITDDVGKKSPSTSVGRAVLDQGEEGLHAAAEDSAEAAVTAIRPFHARHDVGDTRHRAMRFTPVGTSSFVAYFTQRRTVRLTGTQPVVLAGSFVPGTVAVRAAVDPVTAAGTPAGPGPTYTPDRDYTVSNGDGRIARTAGGTIADGASVEVSFVVPPVTRAGTAVTLHVPASVRPPAPAVHSVVPAFQWDDESAGGTRVSVRRGGIVRIYLQRPWYVSGEGELLAVRVLGQGAQPDAAAEQWATMWGRDPIRRPGEAPVIGYPRPADLLGAVDVPVAAGNAMGYPVAYDEQRQLWYADVRFQAQRVHQPFVRLRVARLQPEALRTPEDLRLSREVDAGFVQIPAYRRASVTVTGTTATVTVTGPLPPPGADNITTKMTVSVQARSDTSIDDPAQWVTVGTFPASAVTLPLAEVTGPLARWTGTVPLPAAPPRPQRLLIQEVDEIASPDRGLVRRTSYLDTFTI